MLRTLIGAAIVCALSTVAAAGGPRHADRHQAPAAAMVYCAADASYRSDCSSAHAGGDRRVARAGRQALTLDANGNRQPHLSPATRSLISVINAKLVRWVHPTGKCFGASEQLATFYWQGTRTATGEHFNPHGMTAASRHLAFGTRLMITNPHNDRSVEVVINDRGPYTIADIDLALGAATALGLKQSSYVCVARR